MPRPSKLFVSFHQLRHFLQSKISELVNQHSTTVHNAQLIQKTHQCHSHSIYYEIQRHIARLELTQKNVHRVKETKLLGVLRQHYPMIKVFSSPSIVQRPTTSLWHNNSSQQLRTMMSSSGADGMMGLNWGFPRSMAAGRGNPFAFHSTRQFSTTKSPCISLFQNTTNTANGQQQNIFTHISSRIFSPAGTKINSPSAHDDKKSQARPNAVNDQEVTEETVSPITCTYNRIFGECRGMGELVDQSIMESDTPARLVHRESLPPTTSPTSAKKSMKKLDYIIRHDDLSPSVDSTSNYRSIRRRTIEPPPRTDRKHDGKTADNPITVYLLITLDNAQFFDHNYNRSFSSSWSTENLSSSFIHTVENMAISYQLHMSHVLDLLARLLQLDGRLFRVIGHKNELRIYFPSTMIHSRQEAIQLLQQVGITYNPSVFTIIEDYPYFFVNHKTPLPNERTKESDFYDDLDHFLKEINSYHTSSRPSFAI
ncbi:hypothetical protein BDB01DRAFT_778438 [Pilobolus umbonatus]|nr:hypothetical protein BDB01DRAFT_778438 [Pilobolus umbonatus]